MQLRSKNRKVIVIKETPEMIQEKIERRKQLIKELKAGQNQPVENMQAESMAAANRLDNQARYGTNNFVSEGRTYTKKMRFKK